MRFESGQFYHIYNQGNNKQQLFLEPDNYEYFKQLIVHYIKPNCQIISWCLMPNHYHFLILTNDESVKEKTLGSIKIQYLSNGFRLLQSTYSHAINKRFGWSGSMFRQRYKSKYIDTGKDGKYLNTCFNYIHQNPVAAGLVHSIEDWKYSSFKTYLLGHDDELTEQTTGRKFLEIDNTTFYIESTAKLRVDLKDIE
jgi:REP element-mobilizing transposase RayT